MAALTTAAPCPDCGSPLYIDDEATVLEVYAPRYPLRGAELPKRERPCTIAACSACEFTIELRSRR